MNWQGSVVRVWDGLPLNNGKFVGTAFFIDSRTLLTVKHVVENNKHGIYLDGAPGGGKEKIEPENILFGERDFAILRTSRDFPSIPFWYFVNTELKIGQQLTFAGYIDETQSLHTLTTEISGHVSTIHTWRTQGNISRGMSGGVVMDTKANVVGVIQARDADKNLSYLIPSDVIKLYLDRSDLRQVSQKAPLFNVPPLPSYYMERDEHVGKIKDLLLGGSKNVGITGVSHVVGLQGMGGIGKSILAAVVAHDNQIRDEFPDGIIWASLGQNPTIVEVQSDILKNFDEFMDTPTSPKHGLSLLESKFRNKKILLILDDVWDADIINKYFNISFEESCLLITTRNSQILTSIDAEECKIDLLSQEQSLQLLRKQSKWKDSIALPESAEEIAEQCGGLPLALSMIGAMLKDKPSNRWEKVLEDLKRADITGIKQEIKGYLYKSLFAALQVSVEAQSKPNQNYYIQLAVFPEDVPIPELVLEFYWDKEDLQDKTSTDVIDELVNASLLFRYNDTRVMLHDLQRDYVYSQCGDVQGLHEKMVDAYAKRYPTGWDTIPSEKPYYFEQYFIYHLQQLINKEKSRNIAEKLLNGSNILNWASVLQCAEITGSTKTPKQIAQQVIKTSRSSVVLCRCIQILKNEAKEDARRLLKESHDQSVTTVCLKLLGSEAKEDARRLLKESKAPEVITVCLNLLGGDAKEDARRLLNERKEHEVTIACLRLLGSEAKEQAKQLLKEKKEHHHVIAVCINLLGEEAREDARLLLKERHEFEIINACLRLLGDEAKEDAQRLLKERKEKEVIAACLKLLGVEAREDARRLLKDRKEPEVITTCLNLLGSEAKEDARRLLKENKNQFIQAACLNILGSEASQEALEVLNNWMSKPRYLVAAALKAFASDSDKAEKYCRDILGRWERDIEFPIKKRIKKYSVHIVMSLAHPKLRGLSKFVVSDMLKKEEQTPGFLDPFLYKVAQAISEGKIFTWGEEINPQSL